ncbi:triacylglycerol lipase [Sphingobium sp. B1D7B]|uniref:alpha/beta hydrolase n=1 Tax=Sphingobium TaxID=165695 RepID=UPI0015EC7525|nr:MULTISPECIES: alpha/beta hydrolase [Sphingobium]MCW2362175.1 triacylglycerol lipase [Sphingobium sp. B10D3B]MCW2390401.1 triacylglycerol lipase [Sphingobium sp. B11D3A]MCW2401146.1 triacylglycerol lipase [Sphingobium sp. B10D7B]MCW2405542.1 triacylglycerol lipase [Sphingobium sp. B1D7B]MCW2408126.1 triacylglycerol lipase [Sphingobium xanthum]
MTPEIRKQLEAFGTELTPDMMGGTQGIYRALQPGIPAGARVTRDHQYGPDARNRLDIFTRDGLSGAPVLVFVHGGGFVMGDKTTEGSPFYDNIGSFAVDEGYVGVTMTYRLAPAATWPAGGEDVANAVIWLRENVAQFGGDPDRIFVMGQSAGAVHVADCVARFSPQIAGALMCSGIYDVAAAEPNQFQKSYYGEDPAGWAQASTVAGLLTSKIPLFFSVCEFDPVPFQQQAASLAARYAITNKAFPRLHWLGGHNHLSPVLEIGTPDSDLEHHIMNFIATV